MNLSIDLLFLYYRCFDKNCYWICVQISFNLSPKILFYIAAALTQVKKKYKGFEAPVVSKKKKGHNFFYINLMAKL